MPEQTAADATPSGGASAASWLVQGRPRNPALARESLNWYHHLSAWRLLFTAPALKGTHA